MEGYLLSFPLGRDTKICFHKNDLFQVKSDKKRLSWKCQQYKLTSTEFYDCQINHRYQINASSLGQIQ